MAEERLQKVLAAAGVASRRACEEIITEGRVKVNGVIVTELGTKVDPQVAQITLDDKPISLPERHIYVKLHKPRGILGDSGHEEESVGGRDSILDLLPEDMQRVFPVGRLDLHSEGLVLLTDDGELAHRLTHPRYEHPKVYYVLVEAMPTTPALLTLRHGVDLPEGRTAPAEVEVVYGVPDALKLSRGPVEGVWLRIVLREGKKRQIRQMTGAVGYPTLRLVRWAIGPLLLGDVELGQCKALTPTEVRTLRHAVGLETATPRPKPSKPSPSTRTSTRSAYGARSPRAKAPARGFDKRRPPRPR